MMERVIIHQLDQRHLYYLNNDDFSLTRDFFIASDASL